MASKSTDKADGPFRDPDRDERARLLGGVKMLVAGPSTLKTNI